MLIVENLKRYYEGENVTVKALDDVSFQIDSGDFVAVVGASGSGKSTLLHLIGGLDMPTEGKVVIDGVDLYALKEDERTIFRRRHVGFVFQAYNLLPMLTVYENILLPFGLDGEKPSLDYMQGIVSRLGLEEQLDKMPNALSGGQQQRVAIARALVRKPALILADEPTGNLDSKSSAEVVALFQSINREMGHTIVMITHDDDVAQRAGKILRVADGKLV
ncbi:ABC transporter ATP-binding protein [Aedoeadaptatus coli]|uniref:ABC transporter ATP-binding protein n=1 Tax=Aedoeadaptatus coli TaxID=2058292 RepID=UPI000D5624D2|nr:ABC transporter ATP-binding protein [Peptoniphilus coli]